MKDRILEILYHQIETALEINNLSIEATHPHQALTPIPKPNTISMELCGGYDYRHEVSSFDAKINDKYINLSKFEYEFPEPLKSKLNKSVRTFKLRFNFDKEPPITIDHILFHVSKSLPIKVKKKGFFSSKLLDATMIYDEVQVNHKIKCNNLSFDLDTETFNDLLEKITIKKQQLIDKMLKEENEKTIKILTDRYFLLPNRK